MPAAYNMDGNKKPETDLSTQNSTTSQMNLINQSKDKMADVESLSSSGSEETSRTKMILLTIFRFVLLLMVLYFFICSLGLLGDGFTLLGGRTASETFQDSDLMNNPVCGLMIGVVTTAVLQSSSTSTSLVITMVAANIFTVEMAIPVIMGANIGTSVTGIIVAVSQASERQHFRRAFAGATVHDMFNWLTVIILLPIEVATGYLYHLTQAIVDSTDLEGGSSEQEFLTVLTDPLTDLIVQVDKDVLDLIAANDPAADDMSLLKEYCEYEPRLVETNSSTMTSVVTEIVGVEDSCSYLFYDVGMGEVAVGAVVSAMALVILVFCLVCMVKILKSMMGGQMASVVQSTINSDFPYPFGWATGYAAMVVGAGVTVLVQSSSVVISTLTPLVGLGVVSIHRVFPMMLGANIGTTSTAIMAAFAATGDRIVPSFQISLCHLFFNLSGILIWYPVPYMRRVPIAIAKFLGKTTSVYRWFAILYLVGMFFIIPLIVFGLSVIGWQALAAVGIPFIIVCIAVAILNLLQNKKPEWLPVKLRTWLFLPEWMRSLAPLDRQITRMMNSCTCCSSCPCCDKDPHIDHVDSINTIYKTPIDGQPKSDLNSSQYKNDAPIVYVNHGYGSDAQISKL